ncbi:MAG TPA: hypothetical protein VFW33_19530 [Gemmataceae bacterium]|nr:hypothetical protein [Gemmataceae bacterium]
MTTQSHLIAAIAADFSDVASRMILADLIDTGEAGWYKDMPDEAAHCHRAAEWLRGEGRWERTGCGDIAMLCWHPANKKEGALYFRLPDAVVAAEGTFDPFAG